MGTRRHQGQAYEVMITRRATCRMLTIALLLLVLLLVTTGCQAEEVRTDSVPASPTAAPSVSETADPASAPMPQAPTVTISSASFRVETARTPTERVRGLSGRESLAAGAGMLFIFETPKTGPFWMKGMQFSLDFIWIGQNCTVVDTTLDVLPPDAEVPDSALPLYRSAVPSAYVLEVNGGEVATYGIRVGDEVVFSSIPGKESSC